MLSRSLWVHVCCEGRHCFLAVTSGSYNLFIPFSEMIPDPWEKGDALFMAEHSEVSVLYILTSCIHCHLLQKINKTNKKLLSYRPMTYYCTQRWVCLVILISGDFHKNPSFYACVFCWLVCTVSIFPCAVCVTLYYKGTFFCFGNLGSLSHCRDSLGGVLFTLSHPDPSSAQTYFHITVHLKDPSYHKCCIK